jgi:RHS repeat-associated protein
VTSYSYDALNRLVKVLFPDNISVSYEYDTANRIVKITYPDQEIVKYSYDSRGRLSEVFDQTGNTQYEYDDQTNLVIKERLPNGIITEYSYDSFPRIMAVSHRRSNGTLIVEYQFTYDNNNNCISVKEATLSETKHTIYSYDSLNRLVEVNYSDDEFERYVYDGAGNRLAKITQNETINYEYDTYNRLIRAGETRFCYDASGNLIKKTSKGRDISFGYDAIGKLVSYENGKDKVTFAYDGEGRRISKTVNGKKISFINDPNASLSRVLLEKDEQGKTKKRYVYGFSRLFGQGISGTQFFLYEHPGKSVSLLTDKNQKILENYSYGAFGVKNGGRETPYGYAGEEYDEETGLIYLRARYYDPELGRFISPDSILGVLGDPQTLNAYVYVKNNPINYIDPSGLQGLKVPITIFSNPPGAQTPTGTSLTGHTWHGGVNVNLRPYTQGAWLRGLEFNETERSLCAQTDSFTIWVSPEAQVKAIKDSHRQNWTLWDNCVDHVLDALDAVGYPHPSRWEFKIPATGISSAKYFNNWVREEKNHIDPRFLPGKDDICVPYDFDPPQFRVGNQEHSLLFQPNYGGISLSRTAELMTNISDIAGAVFDQKTGQMILYGKRDLPLPQMHLDDLAVAVRSVYGLGGRPEQDPGISMDPDPNPPKKKKKPQHRMIVTYYGETKDTRFGQVMFEADRLLKNLVLGKDNITEHSVKVHVKGYKSLFERRCEEKDPPSSKDDWINNRMWFVPEKISLVQSEDGSSMVFDQVRMQVLTESKFKGSHLRDRAAEKFATHFTQNYDAFAQQFSVLQGLKRLGKITAIIKWIKEQGLPFDLAFFKNYTPAYVNTPSFTDQITVGCFNPLVVISGGVIYRLDDNNFSTTTSWQANEAKDEILQARPKEEELSWDFGRGYTAVVQTFGKTLKVGDVKKTFVDMSFPVLGTVPLALVRTYDSFNEQRSGFGVGWDVTPAKLRFPDEKRHLRFADGSVLKMYTEIFVRIEGIESLYRIVSLDGEKRPLYRTEGKAALLLENPDGTFSFSRKQEYLLFDSEGKLIRISDKSGKSIDYGYEGGKLVFISQQGKKTIHLEYEGPTIARALGIGGKVIYYSYTPEGQLKEVRDKEGTLASYDYDKDLHLATIFDARGNRVFEANYDIYNRAEEKVINGTWVKQEFSLSERRARIEGANSFFLEQQFDEHYRPQKIVDALGRKLELSYAGPFGPAKTIDNNGLEIFYEYDIFGHPIKIKDAYRGERRFAFDSQGNLIAEVDGMGMETAYCYDEQERLTKIYRPFHCNYLHIENGRREIRGDERFATTFHYDPTTGCLISIDFPGGGKESFRLDENGLPLEICTFHFSSMKCRNRSKLDCLEISCMSAELIDIVTDWVFSSTLISCSST